VPDHPHNGNAFFLGFSQNFSYPTYPLCYRSHFVNLKYEEI